MSAIWFEKQFKKQVQKITGHTLSSIEEESFARIGKVIVRSLVCFTNTYITEVRKRFARKQREDLNREFEKFLRQVKNSIADSFRNALLPSISQNGDPFSLSRFAVLLNKSIKRCQRSSRFKYLPDYRIIHAFELEEASKRLITVLAGFAFDCDPPEEEDRGIYFDLKISNFEEVSAKFFKNGKEYVDLLNLDSLVPFKYSFVNESASAETPALFRFDWWQLPVQNLSCVKKAGNIWIPYSMPPIRFQPLQSQRMTHL